MVEGGPYVEMPTSKSWWERGREIPEGSIPGGVMVAFEKGMTMVEDQEHMGFYLKDLVRKGDASMVFRVQPDGHDVDMHTNYIMEYLMHFPDPASGKFNRWIISVEVRGDEVGNPEIRYPEMHG